MELGTSTSLLKLTIITLVLVLSLMIVNDLIVVFSLKKSISSEIRRWATNTEVKEKFSKLSGDVVDLKQAIRRMKNKINDLDVNRQSLTFTYEANITDLLLAMDAKIEKKPKLFSETFYLRGFPFYLLLSTTRIDVSYLSIFLKSQLYPSYNHAYDTDRPFALQYELSILSHRCNSAREANKTLKGDLKFNHLPYVHGWTKFATLTELMGSGLVRKNAIKLQATLKAYPV